MCSQATWEQESRGVAGLSRAQQCDLGQVTAHTGPPEALRSISSTAAGAWQVSTLCSSESGLSHCAYHSRARRCSGHPCLHGKREQIHHKPKSPHPGDSLEINTLRCSQGHLEFPCSSLWLTGSTHKHTHRRSNNLMLLLFQMESRDMRGDSDFTQYSLKKADLQKKQELLPNIRLWTTH